MTEEQKLPTAPIEVEEYIPFDIYEYNSLLGKLNAHHGLFYQLWNMGVPEFTNRINTAAVTFNDNGNLINFLINKNFWDSLSDKQKLFVICHECLHVSLNHGIRMAGKMYLMQLGNLVMDIVVNHSLVSKFGFIRSEIDPENKYCWVDTVFKNLENVGNISSDETFEYYYNLISKNINSIEICLTVDDHDNMSDAEDILKELGDRLSPEEKESLRKFIEKHKIKESQSNRAGTNAGGMEFIVPKAPVVRKRKWESVIKKWALMQLVQKDKDIDVWLKNRRMQLIGEQFFLPTEKEIEETDNEKKKIQVWFFQDTSGSCSGYTTRFFKAAQSLPTDRFDVKMHCFDTAVYETTLESRKLYGFGGTSFSIIEKYIQEYCAKNKCDYPKAVFVITDGYGDAVYPAKPENWFWFLTPGHSKNCIPNKCQTFLLSDYE